MLSQLSSQGKEFGSVSHGLRDHACADWVRPKLIGLVPSYPAKSEDDQPSPSQAQKLNIRWVMLAIPRLSEIMAPYPLMTNPPCRPYRYPVAVEI